ncbi:hypothetical protein MLD38_017742 [Melastoma candidum]|uniref:Uncharacterized protein n=1 Tax=Melastoma candidum TaxID=119954 RepID=A0ACB9QRJ7_9MYRT|nr:hypothetical protein MLD38_017742 [Melastoma candidum]
MVGVKLDGDSRELLTWALVKVARPGDRVVALHVIDSSTTPSAFGGGTSSLLALVKAFDSVLSVYEGFCNLKQVELKLKVCRGRTAKSALVEEAKACGSSKVILGISKASHAIRSPALVAKYCARNLPLSFSVFAVDNGKVVFVRDAAGTVLGPKKGDEHRLRDYVRLLPRTLSRKVSQKYSSSKPRCLHQSNSFCGGQNGCHKSGLLKADSVGDSDDGNRDRGVENSLALVPFQQDKVGPVSDSHGNRGRWLFLRRILAKKQNTGKSSRKNSPAAPRVSRLSNMQSSAVIYPDEKQSTCIESDSCELDGENGAIVPVDFEAAERPLSPSRCSSSISKELEGLHEKFSSTCRLFTHEELLAATSGFVPENMVGRGGCSRVYRGCLPDGKELAVKVLKPSPDVLQEFTMEIEIVTTLHHSNIISLFGYCCEDNNLILVYDFLHRGSLEENLHGDRKNPNAFGWLERYKVALGVAEALNYMHSQIDEPVIHKDVKSSNILLADDFEPQLSDFGLACRVPDLSCQLTSDDVAGTFGYLAPEYFMHGKVSDKIDVYAFGVVILELLTGRRPIDGDCLKGHESLVMWANPILKSGKVSQLLDPSLDRNYDPEQIGRMMRAASLCIRRSPRIRPQMSTVLKLLQGDEETTEWAREQMGLVADAEEDMDDEEVCLINIQSHLDLALQGLEDESTSPSSSSSQRSDVSSNYYTEEKGWSGSTSLETTDNSSLK